MNNSTLYVEDTPSTSFKNYINSAIYIAVFLFGSTGNIFVLLIVKRKRIRRFNDVFIVNLAVADLCMILFFIPPYTYKELSDFKGSITYCKGVWPLITVSFCSSIFTITTMAVYRCKVIVHPFEPPIRKRQLLPLITGIWLASIILAFPLLLLATYKDGAPDCSETWPSETHQRVYTSILMVLQYFLPLLIIAIAYVLIVLDLTRSKNQPNSDGNTHIIGQARREENIRVIKVLATIVLVFAICMLPGHLAWMLLHFGGENERLAAYAIFNFSDHLAIIHTCLNPVIYGTLTKRFRQGYVKYLTYIFCCRFYAKLKDSGSPRRNGTSEMRTFGSMQNEIEENNDGQ